MIRGDNPITRPEDDVIGRTAAATEFARNVLEFDASEGAVVGVLGPWGTGKTSFINLARQEFQKADVPILDFNPWMFSGTPQLIEAFFIELSVQLKRRPSLDEIGDFLEEYGELFAGLGWIPVVGTWFERVRVLAKFTQRHRKTQKDGVHGKRKMLETALSKLDKPILVVLDDIDRLSSSEIRDIFKLIRLTANFPNIVYLVAFDRGRVEKALAEHGISGRDYLEKILQVAFDLPEVPSNLLIKHITADLHTALADIENASPLDEQLWPDVLMDVIRPLIRNMRDVRRYTATVRGTIKSLNGEIEPVDLLAIEAIRMFVPDVFDLLHSTTEGLTGSQHLAIDSQVPKPEKYLKAQIEGLIKAACDRGPVVSSFIRLIFPAAGEL